MIRYCCIMPSIEAVLAMCQRRLLKKPMLAIWRECLICSSRNEDELATSKRSLALPGLGGACKRHHFSLDRAAASSGVHEDFREGFRFLLVGQRIVGIAKDGMQPAAHDGRFKACHGSGGRADVDQSSLSAKHSNGGFRREAPHGIDDEV